MDPRHDRQLAARALTLTSLTFGVTGPLPGQHAGNEHQERRFEQAMARFGRCHWPQAWTLFTALADEGHAPSARLALLMNTHGPSIYGLAFEAKPVERARWMAAAAPALGAH